MFPTYFFGGSHMKISTKGRYALRMLVDIATHQDDGFIALKTIADRQNISKKYLEQIVPVLGKAGILQANRGFQGGYSLGRPASEISVGEVLRLTEGGLAPVSCIIDDSHVLCDRMTDCPTLPVWQGLGRVINEYLDSVSIQDITDQSAKRGVER